MVSNGTEDNVTRTLANLFLVYSSSSSNSSPASLKRTNSTCTEHSSDNEIVLKSDYHPRFTEDCAEKQHQQWLSNVLKKHRDASGRLFSKMFTRRIAKNEYACSLCGYCLPKSCSYWYYEWCSWHLQEYHYDMMFACLTDRQSRTILSSSKPRVLEQDKRLPSQASSPTHTSKTASLLTKMISAVEPSSPEVLKAAQSFVSFLNKSVTPYHAVDEASNLLRDAGFAELSLGTPWDIRPQGKYFVTKNRTALFAFAVGGSYAPGDGFSIVVGHTDSPCLRVKPISKQSSAGFQQVGCATYGGGIWRTWFDRDLSVAGNIIVKDNDTLVNRLVRVDRPVLYIPNLAIHLETDRTKFEWNNEWHLRPLIESAATNKLNASNGDSTDPRSVTNLHNSAFLKLVADAAGTIPENIVDMDLYLFDTQQASIGGVHNEFIAGARLDNLVGTYTAVNALLVSLEDVDGFARDTNIRVAACFDNEEVGSESAQGAASSVMEWILRKISTSKQNPVAFEEAIAKSVLISADQAHAAHPNYIAKHEENHRPAFHGGVVVKINHNQRYATTSTTHALLKQIAYEAGVPLQPFVVRNDSPCGSTVGPILSAKLGLATIDVGCPQLAMHSIRELADTSSIFYATTLYSRFFQRMPEVLASFK